MAKTIRTRLNEFLKDTDYTAVVISYVDAHDLYSPVVVELVNTKYPTIEHNTVAAQTYEELEHNIWIQIHSWIASKNKDLKYVYKRIMDACGGTIEALKIAVEPKFKSIQLPDLITVSIVDLRIPKIRTVIEHWTALNTETLIDIVIDWINKTWEINKGSDSNERILY